MTSIAAASATFPFGWLVAYVTWWQGKEWLTKDEKEAVTGVFTSSYCSNWKVIGMFVQRILFAAFTGIIVSLFAGATIDNILWSFVLGTITLVVQGILADQFLKIQRGPLQPGEETSTLHQGDIYVTGWRGLISIPIGIYFGASTGVLR